MTGYNDKNVANTVEALLKAGISREILRKLNAGQVTDVFPIHHHRLKQVQFEDTTESDARAGARKLQRQRRSPGTGADHRDDLWRAVVYQCFSASSA